MSVFLSKPATRQTLYIMLESHQGGPESTTNHTRKSPAIFCRNRPCRQPNLSGDAFFLEKSQKKSQSLAIFYCKEKSQGFLRGGGGHFWGRKLSCDLFSCMRKPQSQSQRNRDTWCTQSGTPHYSTSCRLSTQRFFQTWLFHMSPQSQAFDSIQLVQMPNIYLLGISGPIKNIFSPPPSPQTSPRRLPLPHASSSDNGC